MSISEPGRAIASSPRLSLRAWTLLIAYTGAVFFFALGSARTFTGHEGHYAAIVQEMLATGDWLVPRIGGQPWLEKPLLPHWCMAVAAELGGIDEFVLRLPAALVGLLGVCIVASLATRWFGATQGLLAGFIQATTLYTLTYARLAESDIFLWTLILACLWCFSRVHVTASWMDTSSPPPLRQGGNEQRLMFFLLLGLTNLAKGLLFGSVLVLLPCIGFLVLGRCWRNIRWFLYPPGLVLAFLIAIAWPAAVAWQYPEALSLWSEHLLGRLQEDSSLSPKPIWYYATTVPWQVLPWTPLALLGMAPSARRAWREPTGPDRLLWLWFLLPFVLLSLATSKHHHYLIHALPPFSFWASAALLRLRDGAQQIRPVRLAMVLVPVSLLLLGGVLLVQGLFPAFALDAWVLGGLVFAGMTFTALCRLRNIRPAVMGASGFVVLWFVLAYVHAAVLPRTDSYAEETQFLRRMAALAAQGRPILVYQLEPSRILLYCGRNIERFTDLEALQRRCADNPECVIIASQSEEADLRRAGPLRNIDASLPGLVRSSGNAHMTAYCLEPTLLESIAGR